MGNQSATELSRTTLALDELKKVLKLSETPFRIECLIFQISKEQTQLRAWLSLKVES